MSHPYYLIFDYLIIGQVIEGQSTLDNLYKGYGDIPPFGKGPDQHMIQEQGNQYIRTYFPRIDFINSCVLLESTEEEEELIVEEEEGGGGGGGEIEHPEHGSDGIGASPNDIIVEPQHNVEVTAARFPLVPKPEDAIEPVVEPEDILLYHNSGGGSEFIINDGTSTDSGYVHVIYKVVFVLVVILIMLCLYRRYSDPKSYYRRRVKKTKSYDAEV